LDWFLFCAQKLASSASSSSVAFYVASDSLMHVSAFARGIAAAAASAPGGQTTKEWVVLTAEVLNNATDSWTGDTFGDLMVIAISVINNHCCFIVVIVVDVAIIIILYCFYDYCCCCDYYYDFCYYC